MPLVTSMHDIPLRELMIGQESFLTSVLCSKCSKIVIDARECKTCQAVICNGCCSQDAFGQQDAHEESKKTPESLCQLNGCNGYLSQPGVVHKLFQAILDNLQFRCLFLSCHRADLTYQSVGRHVLEECSNKYITCPNKCQEDPKDVLQHVKSSIEGNLPKNYEFLTHKTLQNHLKESCRV